MIVDAITAYLEAENTTVDDALLDEGARIFRSAVRRQLVREEKAFRVSPHNVGQCPRKLSYLAHGYARKPLNARTRMTFLYGDLVELLLVTFAKAAGCPITTGDREVQTEVGRGYIDADYEGGLPVEVKSMSDIGFRKFEKDGIDDMWGYLSQLQCYMRAKGADRGIVVGVRKSTGHMHEEIVSRADEKYLPIVKAAQEAVATHPDMLCRPVWAMDSLKLLTRKKQYEITDPRCRYCDCIDSCWPGVQTEFLSKGPVFRIPQNGMDAPEAPPDDQPKDLWGCTPRKKRRD